MIHTAQWYTHRFMAGLTMAGLNQDGDMEWMGKDKNFTALGWLEDGVYEDLEDKGAALISEYLK